MTDDTTDTQTPKDAADVQRDPNDTTGAQGDRRGTTGEPGDRQPDSGGPDPEGETAEQMLHYGQWIAFGFLVVLALVATIRLYIAASATIDTFVVRRYRSLFVLGFNLAVVLGCAVGLSALVRRLT